MSSALKGKSILITGGTGSFGKRFVETVLRTQEPEKVIVFSRDELKQFEMRQLYPNEPRLRFFLGDIRDADRVYRALHGVDVVIHAAALKQVPTLEYNPFEAVKTNIIGTENLINACIDRQVPKLVALSTDKAVNPINLYGATKLCAEKLFVAGNSYAGAEKTRFSVVRYGNVVGSRGSVIPFFNKIKSEGVLPITDPAMTRFWITLDQGVQIVLDAAEHMQGGEIFVPRIPSMKVTDLARAMAPECQLKVIGIRPGEKIHETLMTADEARFARDNGAHYIIYPTMHQWAEHMRLTGKPVEAGFVYASDNNSEWLTEAQLREMIQDYTKVAEPVA